MELLVPMDIRVFIRSAQKPAPVILHTTFDEERYLRLKVWTTTTTTNWRTDGEPLLYYKFTLWAFGSGELLNKHTAWHKNKYGLHWHSRASNSDYSYINNLIWPYTQNLSERNEVFIHSTHCLKIEWQSFNYFSIIVVYW